MRTSSIQAFTIALGSLYVACHGAAQAGAVCPDVTTPAALNGNASSDIGADGHPRLATDGQGRWVAVWVSSNDVDGAGSDDDILFARSLDNGASWITPALLNDNGAADQAFIWDRAPQIATDGGGNWVVVWHSIDDLGGAIGLDDDIFVARSTTNGATWSSAVPLNDNAGADSGHDTEPQVVAGASGTWISVWTSTDSLGGTIDTDSDILFSRSVDGGSTWTSPAALNTNATTDAGSDISPQLATDGAGTWIAVWSSTDSLAATIDTDRDILVAISGNDGVSWSAPAALNTNAGSDAGEDTQPSITADENGAWIVAWVSDEPLFPNTGTDRDILFSRSVDDGGTWTGPSHLNANATADAGSDSTPRIMTDTFGLWLAIWASTEDNGGTTGFDSDIFFAYSTNLGGSWSGPELFNSTGTNDGSNFGEDPDTFPALATDYLTNWVGVWGSGYPFGGTLGEDQDILFARFQLDANDCNDNDVSDACEFMGGLFDCNDNLILDECETASDCDGNGRPDECDLASPGADCNDNQILDVCEGLPDCNNNGRLDECDLASGDSEDCNGNNVPDECDIASCAGGDPSCQDCTGNGIPDGCEPDCDANGTADSCDIASCPAEETSCQDCDGNGVRDGCDISAGTYPDNNGNGVPDLCEVCTVSTAVTADSIKRCLGSSVDGTSCTSDAQCPGGSCLPPRHNRFLSFEIPPAAAGQSWAIRIQMTTLYDETMCPPRSPGDPDLSDFDGAVRWAGVPQSLPETQEPDPNRFIGAQLGCCPEFRDWPAAMAAAGGGNVLSVYGAETLPCSTYDVQFVASCCPDLTVEACYSPKLELRTGRYGDAVAPYYVPGRPQPSFVDIGSVVSKFKSFLPPLKVDTMFRGDIPPVSSAISFLDIGICVDGFKSFPYRLDGPTTCPPCP